MTPGKEAKVDEATGPKTYDEGGPKDKIMVSELCWEGIASREALFLVQEWNFEETAMATPLYWLACLCQPGGKMKHSICLVFSRGMVER